MRLGETRFEDVEQLTTSMTETVNIDHVWRWSAEASTGTGS